MRPALLLGYEQHVKVDPKVENHIFTAHTFSKLLLQPINRREDTQVTVLLALYGQD